MPRITMASLGIAATLLSAAVFAQSYPAKPVRWIVPLPPGGGTDLISRAIAAKLTEAWKMQVVVENRPGASGTIGLDALVRAPADGYTVALGQAANVTIAPSLYSKVPYDPIKDLAPITLVTALPLIVVCHPSFPARNIKEMVDYARAKPGAINYGSPGNGMIGHLSMEMLKSVTKTDMVHIPYTGASRALTELIAGQIVVYASSVPAAVPLIKSGRLRALAVTTAKRVSTAPDIPAVAETIPGYEAISWYGVFAPAATPRDIVTRLRTDVVKVLMMPDVRERFTSEGGEPVGDTPEQFGAFVKSEIPKWAKVIKDARVKVD
jgi:tripartite-type tricarboxylate transporter receptor subunit TctC